MTEILILNTLMLLVNCTIIINNQYKIYKRMTNDDY